VISYISVKGSPHEKGNNRNTNMRVTIMCIMKKLWHELFFKVLSTSGFLAYAFVIHLLTEAQYVGDVFLMHWEDGQCIQPFLSHWISKRCLHMIGNNEMFFKFSSIHWGHRNNLYHVWKIRKSICEFISTKKFHKITKILLNVSLLCTAFISLLIFLFSMIYVISCLIWKCTYGEKNCLW
jgi:hypothetical protein